MNWFKFYGQDWMTDLKIMGMRIEDRLCFLTLLCLASSSEEQGIIKNCNEDGLIQLTHLYENPGDADNEYVRAKGCLKRFKDKGMITIDNVGNVSVVNFSKRQDSNLTSYERLKRHREKKRLANNKALFGSGDDNNDNVIIDNARLDKIRIDKNRDNIPFESFWKLYPKKTGKKKSEELWKRLRPEEQKAILEDIPKRESDEKWKGGFIKDPERYIKHQQWLDEIREGNQRSAQVIDFNKKIIIKKMIGNKTFRVWFKGRKEFKDGKITIPGIDPFMTGSFGLGDVEGDYLVPFKIHLKPGNYEIMEGTGLLDENKREIFTDDFVVGESFIGVGKIKYIQGRFVFETSAETEDIIGDIKMKIVGNVHQNPELVI